MKAYIQYRIALCLHLEIYLVRKLFIVSSQINCCLSQTLSLLIRNETIRVELIVFLAIFADLATIAIAYDNAPYQPRPVEWQLPKIWIISVILGVLCIHVKFRHLMCELKGILLAAGTWAIRGTLFIHHGGVIQNFGRYVA